MSKADKLYEDQREIHDNIVAYAIKLRQDVSARKQEKELVGDLLETAEEVEKTEQPVWPKQLLLGYAGTGKTTTIAAIVETLLNKGFRVIVAAPTHKAVNVAKRKSGIDGEFYTIQRVLSVKAKPYYETGEMDFEPDYQAPFSLDANTVLCIDETSMLPNNLFKYMMESSSNMYPVIFIGRRYLTVRYSYQKCVMHTTFRSIS